ncbi:MAG: hypothetical protein J3K34DRAFT_471768 [Monoraphidium minutum]|nr:MAG: hypothetical protein J3K34DRAFT_471768 [Monoraphidium minutum]
MAPHGLRLRVRAQQQQRPDDSGSRAGAAGPKPLALPTSIDRMLTRYDFLSTGCGALAVTGYCVMRGQDAGTAALITLTATVVALVANELLFTDSQQ